jgi:hypothetical protein
MGTPGLLALRLKIDEQLITEIETIVALSNGIQPARYRSGSGKKRTAPATVFVERSGVGEDATPEADRGSF